jgi:hypothetical protein
VALRPLLAAAQRKGELEAKLPALKADVDRRHLTDWNRPKQTVHEWKGWRRIGIIPPATPAGRCKATAPA